MTRFFAGVPFHNLANYKKDKLIYIAYTFKIKLILIVQQFIRLTLYPIGNETDVSVCCMIINIHIFYIKHNIFIFFC